jgi:PKD repeat protein
VRPVRTLFFVTILLATAFSGCLADPEAQSVTTTTSSSGAPTASATAGTTGTNGTGGAMTSSAPAENTAPTANLTTDLVNGTAPLNVTFTIDGADEDGDELSWTLDADGDGTEDYNGTEVPSAIVHEFTAVGNYTALLTVTDGTDNATASVDIVVEVPPVTGPNLCQRAATQTAGPVYVFDGDGGTWIFIEANDIPGLQVGNTNLIPEEQAKAIGEYSALWVGCEDADQMVF